MNFNFLEGTSRPTSRGGVGWSFIDTNIPDARRRRRAGGTRGTATTAARTRHAEHRRARLRRRRGVRWDVSSTITLRFGYERHWLDLGEANGTPGFDQLKIGIAGRY